MPTEIQNEPNQAAAPQPSGQPARRPGLTSRDFVIASGDELEFSDHYHALLKQFQPNGAIEIDVFLQMAHASWNLLRIRRMESELFQNKPNAFDDDAAAAKLDRLQRYQKNNERSYYRALKELEKLQTNQALKVEHNVVKSISPVVNIALVKRTQSNGDGRGIISPLPPRKSSSDPVMRT